MLNVFVALPVGFGVNLVLARILGTIDYGRLAFLTSVIDLASAVIGVGLSAGIMQYGAKAHAAGRQGEVANLLARGQGFYLLWVAPVVTVIVITVAHVPWVMLIIAVVFGVWLRSALSTSTISLVLENKTGAEARIVMVSNLLSQVGVLAILFTIPSGDTVWATRLAIGVVVQIAAFIMMRPAYRSAVLRPKLPRGFPAGFWRFSIPVGIGNIAAMLVSSRSEIYALQVWGTPEEIGIFALAVGLSAHLMAPAQAVVGPLIPAVSGLHEVSQAAVRGAFLRTIRVTATIVGGLVASALPALAALVPVLYGRPFAPVAPMLVLLGVAAGISMVGLPIQAFVLARMKGTSMLKINLAALALDAALAFTLIPTVGIWGAVIANASGGLIRLLIVLIMELRSLRTVRHQEVLVSISPAVFSAALAIAAWLAVTRLGFEPVISAFAGSAATVLLLIALLRVTRTGLSADDVRVLVRILPARLQPTARRALRAVSWSRAA